MTVCFFSHIPTTSYGSSPLAGIFIKPLTPYPSSPALCPSATTSSPTLALYSVILPSHFQLYPTCCKTRRPTEIALRKRNIRTWVYRNYYVYEYIRSAHQNGIRVRGGRSKGNKMKIWKWKECNLMCPLLVKSGKWKLTFWKKKSLRKEAARYGRKTIQKPLVLEHFR